MGKYVRIFADSKMHINIEITFIEDLLKFNNETEKDPFDFDSKYFLS